MTQAVVDRAVSHWKSYRWHLRFARESKNRREILECGKAQKYLAIDMLKNPRDYEMPDTTDWLIFKRSGRLEGPAKNSPAIPAGTR